MKTDNLQPCQFQKAQRHISEFLKWKNWNKDNSLFHLTLILSTYFMYPHSNFKLMLNCLHQSLLNNKNMLVKERDIPDSTKTWNNEWHPIYTFTHHCVHKAILLRQFIFFLLEVLLIHYKYLNSRTTAISSTCT